MGNYSSIPEEVLRFKPCNCVRIRNDNGIFRVYKYQSIKRPDGVWTNNYGYLIGKIVPNEGFFPNKRYVKELKEEEIKKRNVVSNADVITDLSYGEYALLCQLSDDIYQKLKKCFPEERAAQIYSYALILCAQGFIHVDQVSDFYDVSYLSWLFEHYTFKMGSTALSNLLEDLGKRTNPIKAFEQMLIDECSNDVAVDGHVIRSCSEENDLAEPGYKVNKLGAPQVNLLVAYDTVNDYPLMYKSFRGSSVDKKSAKDFISSRSFKNVRFVVDGGFYSKDIIDLMSKDGNTYIIPVHTNNSNFKKIKDTLTFSSGEFIYRADKKNRARIVFQKQDLNDGKTLYVFKDLDENNSKCKSYKYNIDLEESGYTEEKYMSFKDWWGVYLLETNSKDSASEIFNRYKNRWRIETYNNYIKNYAGFNDLKLQEYYHFHGFDFIMLVTGLIHQKLNLAVQSLHKTNLSTFDILYKAKRLRMVLQDDEWMIQNTRTKDNSIFEALGFKPDMVLKKNDSYVQKSH